MVDVHSHALFDIDDGSRSFGESIEILGESVDFGIDRTVLTPHFTIGDDIDAFLKKRTERFEHLLPEAERLGMGLVCGAEVYVTDDIFSESDLKKLAIGTSSVMLTEFKYNGLSAQKVADYIDEIRRAGLVPLIAHPERYSYLRHDLSIVNSILTRGALLQINAESLFKGDGEGRFANMLLKNGSVSAVAGDIHRPRSPRGRALARAIELLPKEVTEIVPGMIFDGSDEIYNVEPELI